MHPIALDLAKLMGEAVALLHAGKIIHGDLTTSNMLVLNAAVQDGEMAEQAEMVPPPARLAVIDFGLGYESKTLEDKAVDLYVLERALLSTHPNSEFMFKEVCTVYQTHQKASEEASRVLEKLLDVRARGRKRSMVG